MTVIFAFNRGCGRPRFHTGEYMPRVQQSAVYLHYRLIDRNRIGRRSRCLVAIGGQSPPPSSQLPVIASHSQGWRAGYADSRMAIVVGAHSHTVLSYNPYTCAHKHSYHPSGKLRILSSTIYTRVTLLLPYYLLLPQPPGRRVAP